MIELKFLKEMILIKQVQWKSVILVFFTVIHNWYSLYKGFKFQPYVCNKFHDLLMISMNHSNINILNIKNANSCCTIMKLVKLML